ncbi:MAG TPA: protein-glutamate O-methyltransferase CheR [Candidatus Acidoferrales bacterium]|jgi:chemotaxis protein methyltransferase CheR
MATHFTKSDGAAPVTSNLNDPAYLKIRNLIYSVSGIYHPQNKMYLLAERCARRMSALTCRTASSYLDILNSPLRREEEMRLLFNEITIGETCMFRSMPQHDALRRIILPQIAETKRQRGMQNLHIWSAGCSTGEEPYSLAMSLLEESAGLLKGWKLQITATDLNERSLEFAKAGVYGEYALRSTTNHYKHRYMRPEAGGFRVKDEVKSIVNFSRLNLQDQVKMLFMKGMDIIFCCNVLIYFDAASKTNVIHHFYSALMAGGYLLLGTSESLLQIPSEFRLIHFPGATAYGKPAAPHPGGLK